MSLRVCSVPGCPALIEPNSRGKCAEHRCEEESRHGTAAQRGYGADHRQLREHWKRRMEAGEQVVCSRCLKERGVIHAVDPDAFDLGHDDDNRGAYRGPECRRGNRAAPRRTDPTEHPMTPTFRALRAQAAELIEKAGVRP